MAKNADEMLIKIDSKLDEVFETVYRVDKEVALQKAAFEEHIKQNERAFEEHIKQNERHHEELKRMNDILQQNTESLKEHMHRTALLETIVDKMDKRLSPIELARIEEEVIKKYRNNKLIKIGKVVGIIATLIGILAAAKPYLIKLLLM